MTLNTNTQLIVPDTAIYFLSSPRSNTKNPLSRRRVARMYNTRNRQNYVAISYRRHFGPSFSEWIRICYRARVVVAIIGKVLLPVVSCIAPRTPHLTEVIGQFNFSCIIRVRWTCRDREIVGRRKALRRHRALPLQWISLHKKTQKLYQHDCPEKRGKFKRITDICFGLIPLRNQESDQGRSRGWRSCSRLRLARTGPLEPPGSGTGSRCSGRPSGRNHSPRSQNTRSVPPLWRCGPHCSNQSRAVFLLIPTHFSSASYSHSSW